ncbi:hypothetical protein P691DRAFT_808869 [Macrolepiota fuliginosa MF-IS2]|uniref:Uncharacterized protein n=1 Tax=Macrolepiota fuliginosa MF-IS2 TaxID=1400762 RepID=A0A9P6BZJ2_9AGAR|nr:hypothetical protein P691DRAFT_808869 [Macrolepiota fuliginosa MF-IS2]
MYPFTLSIPLIITHQTRRHSPLRLPPYLDAPSNAPSRIPLDSDRGDQETRYGATRPYSSSTSPPGALGIRSPVPFLPNVTDGVLT